MRRMLRPGETALGEHVVIDAARFSEDLPRHEYLRLLRMWIGAVLPRATFQCERITLGGE